MVYNIVNNSDNPGDIKVPCDKAALSSFSTSTWDYTRSYDETTFVAVEANLQSD
ncbi:hypothetical protein PAXRUDRAFT_828759 [Paxillus rubicundulus Ve08.2h10]|uniref:Uncharacterized protein n=1 Tax=Paxillus rubicundulus Ve08.2h10 TaxID=930991 RepID=A0A0D0D9E4_9AGAM|nr:hypothetical protein PAXRUDRAFT_828759 [Paxillus rubicundulus Ve08.2h10]